MMSFRMGMPEIVFNIIVSQYLRFEFQPPHEDDDDREDAWDEAWEAWDERCDEAMEPLLERPTLDFVTFLLAHPWEELRELGMGLVERLPLAFERPFHEAGDGPPAGQAARSPEADPVQSGPCATPEPPPLRRLPTV